jgi:opacity protein-like surface antigen
MLSRFASIASLALFTFAGVAVASAADYMPPPPPPVYQPPQECCNNWYLRGQVGVGMTDNASIEYIRNPANSNNFQFEQNSMGDTTFFGLGLGYEFNNWLRFDGTIEYRNKTQVNAFGSYTYGGGTFGDAYQGYIKSWVLLANAYVDLGTWYCLTPFVGAGVGGAYTTLADFTDIGIGTSGRGIGNNGSDWNMAWALYAGVAYNVTKNFKVELAYRYLDYGSVTDSINCIGGCYPDSYKFSNLHSNDFMLSLRWTCCEIDTARYVYAPPPPAYEAPPAYPPPPAYQPQPPVYQPAPPAYQPPLQSRG